MILSLCITLELNHVVFLKKKKKLFNKLIIKLLVYLPDQKAAAVTYCLVIRYGASFHLSINHRERARRMCVTPTDSGVFKQFVQALSTIC